MLQPTVAPTVADPISLAVGANGGSAPARTRVTGSG
jgi:hypothetical protein